MKKILLLSLTVIVACSTKPKTTETETWSQNMQSLAGEFYSIFPLVADPAAFKNPENHAQIAKSMNFLASQSHEINKMAKAAGDSEMDPVIKALSDTFKKDLLVANDSFNQGNYEFARVTVYNSLQFCIQCHTRKMHETDRKAYFDPQALAGLKPLYRADWLAATRNFDDALKTYQQVIDDKQLAQSRPAEWRQAIDRSLAISVRVKDDPALSQKIVEKVIASSETPHFLRNEAMEWKKQIATWRSPSEVIKKRGSKLDRARALMSLDRTDKQFINYLRAASLLHSYVSEESNFNKKAQGYLLLGKCYEALTDPGLADFSKGYYKSCILSAPHTSVAMECYDAFEEWTLMNSFDGMTPVSPSALDYLKYLKAMARPQLEF